MGQRLILRSRTVDDIVVDVQIAAAVHQMEHPVSILIILADIVAEDIIIRVVHDQQCAALVVIAIVILVDAVVHLNIKVPRLAVSAQHPGIGGLVVLENSTLGIICPLRRNDSDILKVIDDGCIHIGGFSDGFRLVVFDQRRGAGSDQDAVPVDILHHIAPDHDITESIELMSPCTIEKASVIV